MKNAGGVIPLSKLWCSGEKHARKEGMAASQAPIQELEYF
jgi:hypothetical protein